jgi:hypothetical protein
MPLLLYSTNVYLKFMIQRQYRGDKHFIWCSEAFDSTKLSGYTFNAHTPPSSNPVDIYRELSRDVSRKDAHSAKINEQKLSLGGRAIEWHKNGEITEAQREDIMFLIKTADFSDWRPLIYIIPFDAVKSKIISVPAPNRAGMGMEYTVSDLSASEFDVIEI